MLETANFFPRNCLSSDIKQAKPAATHLKDADQADRFQSESDVTVTAFANVEGSQLVSRFVEAAEIMRNEVTTWGRYNVCSKVYCSQVLIATLIVSRKRIEVIRRMKISSQQSVIANSYWYSIFLF